MLKVWPAIALPKNLDLESFTWGTDPKRYCSISQSRIARIAAMTNLTHLELARVQPCKGAKQLHSLILLRTLILRKCAHLGEQLLQPGAFDKLRELEITDDFTMTARGYPILQRCNFQGYADFPWMMARNEAVQDVFSNLDTELAGMRKRAVECMATVMDLPHIEVVSGNASLFTMGLAELPQGWALSSSHDNYRIFTKI